MEKLLEEMSFDAGSVPATMSSTPPPSRRAWCAGAREDLARYVL